MKNLPSARQLFKGNKLANTKRTLDMRQRGLYAFRLLLRFDSAGHEYYYVDIVNRFLRAKDEWASYESDRFIRLREAKEHLEDCVLKSHNHYNKLKKKAEERKNGC